MKKETQTTSFRIIRVFSLAMESFLFFFFSLSALLDSCPVTPAAKNLPLWCNKIDGETVMCLVLFWGHARSHLWYSIFQNKLHVHKSRKQVRVLTVDISWRQLRINPMPEKGEKVIFIHLFLLETQQPLKQLDADCSRLSNALSMLVVQVYDISSVEWFCCYGKSAKKGRLSCRAQILGYLMYNFC